MFVVRSAPPETLPRLVPVLLPRFSRYLTLDPWLRQFLPNVVTYHVVAYVACVGLRHARAICRVGMMIGMPRMAWRLVTLTFGDGRRRVALPHSSPRPHPAYLLAFSARVLQASSWVLDVLDVRGAQDGGGGGRAGRSESNDGVEVDGRGGTGDGGGGDDDGSEADETSTDADVDEARRCVRYLLSGQSSEIFF